MRQQLPALAFLAAFGTLRVAHAYCFTTTCKDEVACDGARETGDGCVALRWKSRCMGFSVEAEGGANLEAEDLEILTELAFDAWLEADCGDGRSPGLVVQNMGQVTCDRVQYNKDGGNANVVVVRAEKWPHPDTGHNIALTTTTFDPETGDLLDADIELNADGYVLTVSDEAVEYDLLSVLTHEAGHFLGLGHTPEMTATMFATYSGGTTDLRTLEPDDVAAICDLYPPEDEPKASCNPLPKHGFSPQCRDDQTEGSCSYAPPGRGSAAALGLALAAFAAVRTRTARRRRSGSRSA